MKLLLSLVSLLLLFSCENDLKKKSVSKTELPPIVTKPRITSPPNLPPPPSLPPTPILPKCADYCKSWSPENSLDENTLSFANFGYRGIGRCRGHSLLTQKLSQLLIFSNNQCESNFCEDENLENIKKAIYQYELVPITNAKNLLELSLIPEIKSYLMAVIRGTSHKFSARKSPIEITHGRSENENIFLDIKRRIDLKMIPYLGIRGTLKISSHALLAYKYKNILGTSVICIEDSNYVPDIQSGQDCDNFLFYNPIEDELFYHIKGFDEKLASLNIYEDDDDRFDKYTLAWENYCHNELVDKECIN